MTKELGLKDEKKISMLLSEKILKFYTCKMLKCMGHQNVLVLTKFYAVELGSSNKPIKTCKVWTIEKLVMVNFLILTLHAKFQIHLIFHSQDIYRRDIPSSFKVEYHPSPSGSQFK